MEGFLLIAFIKMIFNPYPTLFDLTTLAFLILMNITLITNRVEAISFMTGGIFYGCINTWLLLRTWQEHFSGNANFVFFQIIAMDAFIIIFSIQVFQAIDQKRKKYAQELLRIEDRKKPKEKIEKVEKVEEVEEVEEGKR